MKLKKLAIILYTIVGCCFLSCSKEDDDGGYSKLANQENKVEFKVYSNTIGVPIKLSGVGQSGYLTIKDYYEEQFVTKNWGAGFEARCDDPTVLMTGEIYVNGKLKSRIAANERLKISVTIKGNGY